MSDNPTLPPSKNMLPWREEGTPEGLAEAENILSVGYMIYKQLSPEDESRFRSWARKNYTPFTNITGSWHPVTQLECVLMNHEAAFYRQYIKV